MSDWLGTPVIVIAVLAVLGAVFGVGKWVGSVNTDRANFREFMNEIREDIKKIFQRLPTPRLVSGQSPLHLTEFGKKVAECLQAHAWASGIAPSLVSRVTEMKPFEIDEFAQKYVSDTLGEWEQKIAVCAYEHGLRRDQVPVVLQVLLREELLQLTNHPEAKA